MAASNQPKLSVIGEAPTGDSGEPETQRAAEAASSETAGRAGPGPGRLIWLMAALLLAVSAFFIAQMQHVRELEGRVQTLTVELSGARQDVEAHRQHLRAVRGEVGAVQAAAGELERRIAELDKLAGRDPLEVGQTP